LSFHSSLTQLSDYLRWRREEREQEKEEKEKENQEEKQNNIVFTFKSPKELIYIRKHKGKGKNLDFA